MAIGCAAWQPAASGSRRRISLGGVRVDAWGRVLDRDGAAVPGLYCAGGDAGGLQGPRYVAGLMLGMVFGPRAVEAVVMDKEEIDGA
jgi:predicted oxidoreductase